MGSSRVRETHQPRSLVVRFTHPARPHDAPHRPEKAMLEYGDPGAVSAKSGVLDRHPPAGEVDHHGRTTVVPLSRRISRRISNTLNVESTCWSAAPAQNSSSRFLTRTSYRRYNTLMATVTITPEALKEAEQLPAAIRGRLRRLVLRLADWPDVSGVKPLSGKLAGRYRVRTGDYRMQFRVLGDTVIVEKIGHRDRFYED